MFSFNQLLKQDANMQRRASCVASVFVMMGSVGTSARAGFLDIQTLTFFPGSTSFNGSLDGVPIVGTAGGPAPGFAFYGTGSGAANSTTDGSSPQYSYASVYSPTAALADRVGVVAYPGVNGILTFTFGVPVTDLRFHVADLDGAAYSFALTGGLNSISLVSGNGGSGDGLQVVGGTVSDIDPTTFGGSFGMFGGNPPTTPPPITGPRAAYGTVSLNGTYTTLTVNVTSIGDTGSFTLSSVPEPTAMALTALAAPALLRRRRATA